MKKYFAIFTLAFLISLSGCDSTRLVGSYKSPELDKAYESVAVLGVSGDLMPEEKIEYKLVENLEESKIKAMVLEGEAANAEMEFTEDDARRMSDELKAKGYESILTFSLISVDEETEYVPGTYAAGYYPVNYPYYNTYWDYYGYYAPLTYSPGYYTSNTVYNMEANLYDLNTDELVWAVRSETIEPVSIESFSENFAEEVAERMISENIVK